jgi:isoleucyl-tRNA synthetase
VGGSSDYSSDIRFGPGIIQGTVESYRKLRNTLRWMLGTLGHYDPKKTVAVKVMPELERLMLHRLTELDVADPQRPTPSTTTSASCRC